MVTIAIDEVLGKLPEAELQGTIERFVRPMAELLPDRRLGRVVGLAVQGVLGGESPVVTEMTQSGSRREGSTWAKAKRVYRFLSNNRFSHRTLAKGLYRIAQRTVADEQPERVVVALDPVNFEKPYTEKLEGVSTVRKSTPPDLHGQARLTHGYPAMTATVVNTRVPAISYASWFSYTTADFVSQNREVFRAIGFSRRLFPDRPLRFVGDAGLDDRKVFERVERVRAEFVFRAQHLERLVEVYNERLDRWETEALQDLVESVPWAATWQVAFHHAGRTRLATVQLGWLRLRLPDSHRPLWALVAYEAALDRTLVLLTNVPLTDLTTVQSVYADWRLRARIEHGYRFDQEQGLDVEDMRVRTLERMRRLFLLVLLAAQVVFLIHHSWPPPAVRWLHQLGGKLGLASDRDGPYLLLRGLRAVFQTVATLTHLALLPFPKHLFTYG
jgi:hypothetical protein